MRFFGVFTVSRIKTWLNIAFYTVLHISTVTVLYISDPADLFSYC